MALLINAQFWLNFHLRWDNVDVLWWWWWSRMVFDAAISLQMYRSRSSSLNINFEDYRESALHPFRGHREGEKSIQSSIIDFVTRAICRWLVVWVDGAKKREVEAEYLLYVSEGFMFGFSFSPRCPGRLGLSPNWCSHICCNIIIFRFQQQTFHSPLRVRSGNFYFNFRIN